MGAALSIYLEDQAMKGNVSYPSSFYPFEIAASIFENTKPMIDLAVYSLN